MDPGDVKAGGPVHGQRVNLAATDHHQLVGPARRGLFECFGDGCHPLTSMRTESRIRRKYQRVVVAEPPFHLVMSTSAHQQPLPCRSGAKMSTVRWEVPGYTCADGDEPVIGNRRDQGDPESIHVGLKSGSGGGGDHSGCSRIVANSKSIRQNRPSVFL